MTNRSNETLKVVYSEADPLEGLEGVVLQAVHAFCFYGDRLIVVYADSKGYWTPPGGGIEVGESYQQATKREVMEETNMKVLKQQTIGYQDVYEKNKISRQTRSVCLVEPYGDFVSDPDGDVTAIKLIDTQDYKQYFDWKEIGERIMERAMEIRERWQSDSLAKSVDTEIL